MSCLWYCWSSPSIRSFYKVEPTSIYIWHNSVLTEIKARDARVRVLQSLRYISVSGDALSSSIWVENYDLHGNWLNRVHVQVKLSGHDRVTVQITVFDSNRRDWRAFTCWFVADCNIQIKELELLVRNSCLKLANSLLCHIWKLVPPAVTHVISFTRLPLFSRATLKRSELLGTRLQKTVVLNVHYVASVLLCVCCVIICLSYIYVTNQCMHTLCVQSCIVCLL